MPDENKNGLGRGLGDLIQEVSNIKGVPQPAAEPAAESAAEPAVEQAAEPAAEPAAPQPAVDHHPAAAEPKPHRHVHIPAPAKADAIIEEQGPDTEEAPARKLRMWQFACLAMLLIAGFLAYRLSSAVGAKNKAEQIAADLSTDPLAWTADMSCDEYRVTRVAGAARVVFTRPLFRSGAQLSPAGEESLRRLLAALGPNSSRCSLVIIGHTAPMPGVGEAAARETGLQRAAAVAANLIGNMWSPSRISLRSNGDRDLPFPGDDPATQARNKTVSIEIRSQR